MTFRFELDLAPERTSGVITFTVEDESGSPVALAAVTTFTLTLYDRDTRQIINSRQNQNVLNANNVTMHATSGLVTWTVQPADMACVSERAQEIHVALFVITWNSGAKQTSAELILPVANLVYHPSA